jgi:Arc/MetJ family transcription regulator
MHKQALIICTRRQIMRTTFDLDEEALGEAMRAARGKTKTAVINEALRDYARRHALHGLLKFRGKFPWQGNLDSLRGREGKAHQPVPSRGALL